jgi:hypothetical protein
MGQCSLRVWSWLDSRDYDRGDTDDEAYEEKGKRGEDIDVVLTDSFKTKDIEYVAKDIVAVGFCVDAFVAWIGYTAIVGHLAWKSQYMYTRERSIVRLGDQRRLVAWVSL